MLTSAYFKRVIYSCQFQQDKFTPYRPIVSAAIGILQSEQKLRAAKMCALIYIDIF